MRINLLSSFAAGMLIATAVSAVAYFSNHDTQTKAPAKTTEKQVTVKVQPSEADMKNKLTSAGYVVQTKADYDKSIAAAKTAAQKAASTTNNQQQKAVNKVIINVTDGMTSIDVGKMLQKANIVPNAFNFSKDIEKKHLENKLKPGVFVVDSSMNYNQVVAAIFK